MPIMMHVNCWHFISYMMSHCVLAMPLSACRHVQVASKMEEKARLKKQIRELQSEESLVLPEASTLHQNPTFNARDVSMVMHAEAA